MERSFEVLVRGGTCVLQGVGPSRVDLGVSSGKITAIGDLAGAAAELVLDARHLHVLPGVIDTQAQLHTDGGGHLLTGGTTSILDPRAHVSSAATLEEKLSRARGRACCDYAFFLGATLDNLDELDRLERLPGCAGLNLSIEAEDELVHRTLGRGFRRVTTAEPGAPSERPVEAGAAVDLWLTDDEGPRAVSRFLGLAKRAGRRVHIQRVRGAEALATLVGHRDLATLGCAAPHLSTGEAEAEALWQAVRGGLIDVLESDPATAHLLLAQALEHVHAGRMSLTQAVELLSSGPARVYNLARKGRLSLGFDADLVLVDLGTEHTHGGVRLHGAPLATMLRGQVVVQGGRLTGANPCGAPIRFSDTLRMVVL